MQNKTMISLIMVCCLFIFGCTNNNDCCNCCDDKPTPYNTYVVCDNQKIWDERNKLNEFKCECDNYGCNDFPSQRNCNYGVWVMVNNNLTYENGEIHCSEIVGKDGRCK